MISLRELKERKVVQWAIAYAAGAWLLLEVASLLSDTYGWPAAVMRTLPVLLLVGLLAAVVLAWFHGEKGAQRVSGVETAMLAGILVIAGGVVALVGAEADSGAQESAPALASALSADAVVAEQGSIAVLPFVNVSSDPEQEYFSDGITEELLNVLAQLPELRVASRTSAFSFKGKDVAIDSIAGVLNVRHVLEGSVRKAGNQLRITAQLIDASTGYHLWSETYNRELKDVFAVQDEISREIVRQLQIELSDGREQGRLARVETTDPEAHTLVLKATQIMRRSTEEALEETEELLTEALERDSEYAQARALMATVHAFRAYRRWSPPRETFARAEAEAEQALVLNPSEARAHYVLGQIAMWRDWDWTAAERHFARAIEVNPGFAPAYSYRARLLAQLGRSEEAIRSAERSVELDPLAWPAYNELGAVYTFVDQSEKAAEPFREALRLAPGHPSLLGNLSYTYAELDRYSEAIRAAEQAVEAAPEYPGALAALAHAHACAGNRTEAEQFLRRLEAMPNARLLDVATVHAGLGNRDRVLDLLEQAYEEREGAVSTIGVDPIFREYWREPRVRHLLERIGLP